jgi:hypothetical protein
MGGQRPTEVLVAGPNTRREQSNIDRSGRIIAAAGGGGSSPRSIGPWGWTRRRSRATIDPMVNELEGLLTMGNSALEDGRWSDARDAFQRAVGLSDSPEALNGLDEALWWLGGDSRLRRL